jgi:hypothetical protein
MQPDTPELLPNQTPYAIVKLEESARIIRQSINELPALRKRLEKNKDDKTKARDVYGDLQNQHRRLLTAFDTAALSLLESEQDELASYTAKLRGSINAFKLMTPDFTKLCMALTGYLSKLPLSEPGETDSEAQTTNNRIIGRLMNNVRMGYYPTCTDNLAHVVNGIEFPEDVVVNLLDPCCGCGIALRSMAERIADNGINCRTFGIELDTYRAEEALTRIDRVGFGSFYHSRISNEVFHAMLLNPPYLSVMTEGGNNTRSEKRFLVDSISDLMHGGLLIYIIPHYRLTADIARILCENFNDLTVWKFTANEFKKFKQVAILGTRRKRQDASALVHELTSLVISPENLPELPELPAGRYQLPATSKEVAMFKGAEFNKAELAEQLRKSTSFSRLFQQSELANSEKRPLLPLSIGQIGLVGGSGLINGPLDCETPHIIKGRVVKEKRARSEDNTNAKGQLLSTTLTETISNKLIFNILTPDGFLSLTDSILGSIVDDDDEPSEETNSIVSPTNFNGTPNNANDYKLFPPGKTVITQGTQDSISTSDIGYALHRHLSGDWGEVSDSDQKSNDSAVNREERIISSYLGSDGNKFWIITEADRSYTTVLLPDEVAL